MTSNHSVALIKKEALTDDVSKEIVACINICFRQYTTHISFILSHYMCANNSRLFLTDPYEP